MQIGAGLLKYKQFKFVESKDILEENDYLAIACGLCPFCHRKLYEMDTKKLFYCKSKKCKKHFAIHSEKYFNIKRMFRK